jgi:hypothetical protein
MNHGVMRRWGGGLAVVFAAAMAGCAVEPAEATSEATTEVTSEATTEAIASSSEVTALSSEPDAEGLRTWWIFHDGRGDAVRATDVYEALRVARIARARPGVAAGTDEIRTVGEVGGGYGAASIGIGGGGR